MFLRDICSISFILIILQQNYTNAESYNEYTINSLSTINSPHEIVRPKIINGLTKKLINQTNTIDSQHVGSITIEIELNGVFKKLDLKLNTDLIAHGFKHIRQHQGKYIIETPQNEELCHYQGEIQGMENSWVAVSTCGGLNGAIYDGKKLYHIHPKTETADDDHYLFKHDDFKAHYTHGFNETLQQNIEKSHRNKRWTESVRGPANANETSRYIEIVFVVDKSEYIHLGSNLTKVHRYCKDLANIVNSLYRPLNIFIALVGIEVWSEKDRFNITTDSEEVYQNFMKYRMNTLVKSIPNDNAQLLTNINFQNGIIGKALRGLICSSEFSGGLVFHYSDIVGLVAATMTHEIGHNLGIDHDTKYCSCSDKICLMSATANGVNIPIHWSNCSFQDLAEAKKLGLDYCLLNKPKKLFDGPFCGNEFVEPGEECDCGLPENCENRCCNAATCKLHSNAACATGTCCDLTRCSFKKAETLCRSSQSECDLPEYCNGKSEYCPQNIYKIDGEKCNSGGAFCYQGNCQSHSDQCRKLWGTSNCVSNWNCYNKNTRGNCGYVIPQNDSTKCEKDNALCGRLYCNVRTGETLQLGRSSISQKIGEPTKYGDICQGIIIDLGLNDIDPGLVPNGAKCGDNKMCVNQICMPVENVKEKIYNDNACRNNCGGHGVCNSLGHCHCNQGYQPPDCQRPGYGGSIDTRFSRYHNDTQSWHTSNLEKCSDDPVDLNAKVNLNLKVYPSEETAKPGSDITLTCRDEGNNRAFTRWTRAGNLPLPPKAIDNGNRLDMFNVQPEHAGVYICEAYQYPLSFPGRNAKVNVIITNI